LLPSGSRLRTLFSPNPEDPLPEGDAGERAVIGVVGDGEPGRGHWFFTPAPLYFALGGETWIDVALAAPVDELRLAEVGWDAAPEEHYARFLSHLEEHGVVPGTVVLDDKWQGTYGGNEPDEEKWPDLKGWIAKRHAGGQRVLLWWKAWDPEGLEPELCVR